MKSVLSLAVFAALGLSALAASPARALCIYNGEFNVKTTFEQEFADSRWVVRAKVIGVDTHWSDGGEPWVLYRLEITESLKGEAPRRLDFFTTRDSGGFYLDEDDRSFDDSTNDWLLFLNPSAQDLAPPGAVFVNYSCGRSARWGELSEADRATVRRLAAGG